MTLKEAKKLLIKTLREKESLHYTLGWLEQAYYQTSDDEIEAAVVTRQLAEYGIIIQIKGF